MNILTFDEATFDHEVLQSSAPVLVDFYADWCGPCRMQAPIVEQLAEDFKNKDAKIGKLNVDYAPAIAQRYGVMSIPTIIIFKNGQPAEVLIGVQDKKTLTEKLDALSN